MKKMKKLVLLCFVIGYCLFLGACDFDRPTEASDIAPTLDNLVVVPNPAADVRILDVEIEEGVLEKVWEVAIPWSKDGLGRGEKYLGYHFLGAPVDAQDPWYIAIGPGPTIVVDNFEQMWFYDIGGNLLEIRTGCPRGFLSDGTLIASAEGALLCAYDAAGNVLWQVDREEIWREVMQRHAPDKEAPYDRGTLDFFVSLEDLIYVRVHYYRLGQSAAHEKETVEIEESLDATLVYQPNGELLYSIPSPNHPTRILPTGEFFGTHVAQEDGSYAHRIFAREEDRYILKRTLYLPSAAIRAVGNDGSILCTEPMGNEDKTRSYTVYHPDSARALRFALPEGYQIFRTDFDGYFYTRYSGEDAFVVTKYKWPVP